MRNLHSPTSDRGNWVDQRTSEDKTTSRQRMATRAVFSSVVIVLGGWLLVSCGSAVAAENANPEVVFDGTLNSINKGGFSIALKAVCVMAQISGRCAQAFFNVSQSFAPVDSRFPRSQQIEVRAVKEKDSRHEIWGSMPADGRKFNHFGRKIQLF